MFQNVSIRSRLLILLVIPLLFLIYFSYLTFVEKSSVVAQMNKLQQVSDISVDLSALVHELQKERGLSAGYIGSKGKEFFDELSVQRLLTSQRIRGVEGIHAILHNKLFKFDISKDMHELIDEAIHELSQVDRIRNSTDKLRVSGAEQIEYYSNLISKFLKVIFYITQLSDEPEISNMLSAYINLVKAKESAGQERAVLQYAFTKNKISSGLFIKFGALVTEQRLYLDLYQSFAPDEQIYFFNQQMNKQKVDKVDSIRGAVLKTRLTSNFNTNPSEWWQVSTARINILKVVEDNFANNIRGRVKQLKIDTNNALALHSYLVIAGVIFTFLFLYFLSQKIIGPITTVATIADRLASGERNVDIKTEGNDEAGRMLSAMKKMAENVSSYEKEIEDKRELLDVTLHSIGDAVITTDLKGNVVLINKVAERLTGWKEEEAIGKSLGEIFYIINEATREHCENAIKKVLESGESIALANGTVLVARDGTERTIVDSGAPIRDKNSNIIGMVLVFRDITKEQLINENINKLSQAVEQSPAAVIITDVDSNIEYINPRFEKTTGYTAQEVMGRNPRIFKSGLTPKETYKDLWETITGGDTWHGELCNRKKNHEILWEGTSISPVKNQEGEITHYVAVKIDITELKKAQEELISSKIQAESANHAKSEFLANMSHEIRTPMNGIIGMTDITLDTELSDEQYEYLSVVKKSATSLMSLLNDILDFSKMEAGKLELQPIDFNVHDTISDVINIFRLQSEKKGVQLDSVISPNVQRWYFGDPGRLRQIISNLVSNAIKFTHQGTITLSVDMEEQASGIDNRKTCLYFSVTDTGIGIPEDKKQTIFESFSQADNSISNLYGGTGLGLSISRELVGMMGGKMWVESVENDGSTFHFTVYLGRQEKDEDLAEKLMTMEVGNIPALLISQNIPDTKDIENSLRKLELNLVVVNDGESALNSIEQAQNNDQPFVLVFIVMPVSDMDDFELVKRIKQTSHDKMTGIILLTHAGQRGDAIDCIKLEISAYLTLPVDDDVLKEVTEAVSVSVFGGTEPSELITTHSLRERKTKLKILLAEDNKMNQNIVIKMLEKRSNIVKVAETGKQVLEMLEYECFDLILMDLQMPEMGGIETVKIIRENENKTGVHIPIIAMTAHAIKGTREECLSAGMDEYITKPVEMEKLLQLVNNVIGR